MYILTHTTPCDVVKTESVCYCCIEASFAVIGDSENKASYFYMGTG
jgi:hypothetical protein